MSVLCKCKKMSTKFDLRYKDVPVLDPSDQKFEEEAEKLLKYSLFIDGGA